MKTLLTQLRFALILLVLCSCIYPALVWSVGRTLFARKADGSLVRGTDGSVVGSELIGQRFSSPGYFHGRPSAVGWNASGSGGSNLAPTNPALVCRIANSVTCATQLDGLSTSTIAADRVFVSGSGLDPDVTPDNARQQVVRVARARGLSEESVCALVAEASQPPLAGLLGPARVNVLRLNLSLDLATSTSRQGGGSGDRWP